MVKLGPSQMKGTIWDEGEKNAIVQILISYGTSTIDSIQFVYVDEKEKLRSSQIHGQPSLNFSSVVFNYPSEFLTSVSGMFVSREIGHGSLASITFGTNIRKYGPYGMIDEENSICDFNYEFGLKDFGGFHGADRFGCVNSIGIYVNPIKSLNSN